METIFDIVETLEKNLLQGQPIKIGKYATHDHAEKIATIDAYTNSQHISGETDSLNREKPFFNIVLTAAYTWYKLTNIDRKHIRFTPANAKQRLKALVATIKFRKWMNEKRFGDYLNKWGWTLAKYGSAVSKFVEKDGKLIPSIISWDRLICDPVDFTNNPKIEKLYFTPAQLREQSYDQDKIEEAIESFAEARENLEGDDIDIKNEYIGLYEIHGKLPLSMLKMAKGEEPKEKDETEYLQQMHVVFMHDNPKEDGRYEVTLYSGREKKDPYQISHLIEQDGRTLSVGAVETLFDPQWMVNHYAKLTKDQLDLASKLITQTSDPDFVGRNIMTDVDTGSVLVTRENQPLTQLNTKSHDIQEMASQINIYRDQGRQISGAHEAVTGEQPPSGTPYALQAMLGVETRGLFDLMRQSKGLYLEEAIREFILPHFKKQLNNSDDLMETLEGEELENFDDLTLPIKLHQELMARLKVGIPSREEIMMAIEEQDNAMGNVRVLKPEKGTWEDYFEDFDLNSIEVEITGENRDKQAIITTLDTILQRMMANPEALNHPDIRKVFNKIIDEVGPGVLSPLQLSGISQQETTGGEPAMAGAGEVGMSEGLTQQMV